MTTLAGSAPLVPSPPRAARLEGVSWLLILGALGYVVTIATATGDAVLALHVAALFILGTVVFRGVAGSLFRGAFALNLVWVFILAGYFTRVNGAPFTAGGDDLMLYEISTTVGSGWASGNWGSQEQFTHYSGYGYILLGAAIHFISVQLGEVGPLLIRAWGAFAGATIGPAVYLLARTLAPAAGSRFWTATAVAAGMFPILMYYSAIGLRDIWLAAIATWFMALLSLAHVERAARLHAWIGPAGLLLLGALFRPESALALIAFWLGVLYARRHTTGAKLTSAIVIASAVAFGILFAGEIAGQIVRQQLSYEYAVDEAGAGSLGARVLQIPPPLGYLARFAFALVTPVPPMAAIRADTILIGIGATAWYFVLPFAIAGYRDTSRRGPEQKAVAGGIVAFATVLLIGIALTSIDLRHKIPLLPAGIVLAAVALQSRDRRWSHAVTITTTLAGAALAAMYLLLKFT